MSDITLSPVAVIRTPYKQKFAVPRQPGLVKAAKAELEFLPPYDNPECVRGIEEFSHLWLLFRFHHTADKGWSPLVRPPRLGGNKRIGVFATRSTFRPNAMGLSVVKLLGVEITKGKTKLILEGADLVDGTPVFDVKPYLPYSDAHPTASGGYADDRPDTGMTIEFSSAAYKQLAHHQQRLPELKALIEQVLQQDPRPAYKQGLEGKQSFGMSLYDLNIKYWVDGQITHVTEISTITADTN
ncbi:tRNA (N6-threonylcarbamoyladenosine(37)-N6)-methyltransferase TrmO [Corallincola platygyrae]|uniref:tRNA (N6-threonylcarbamoyladenosine(37)-N6)-methyltransferase TrmO n=1 Tax=Corallincola platygyrae TaxID=1193278 RepID=A0ABW4XQE7_9GAMM